MGEGMGGAQCSRWVGLRVRRGQAGPARARELSCQSRRAAAGNVQRLTRMGTSAMREFGPPAQLFSEAITCLQDDEGDGVAILQ